jgi:hypothetical protein
MKRTLVVAVTAAILLGNAAIAVGADMCLVLTFSQLPHPAVNTLILKDFSLPAKGKCKETRGFYTGGGVGPGRHWVTGMACGSSDGARVTFVHTGIDESGTRGIADKITFDRRLRSGLGKECFPDLQEDGSCYSELMRWEEVLCGQIVPVP